jgi:hypothetical protein
MQIYSDPKQMISKRHLDERFYISTLNIKDSNGITFPAFLSKFKNVNKKYSKAPHHAEDVMPVETAAALSFQHIKFLEMYCKLAGIKLIWSTWDIHLEMGLEYHDHEYENFISTGNKYWHSRKEDSYYDRIHLESDPRFNSNNNDLYHTDNEECNRFVDCHSEFREKYGKNWDVASDLGFTVGQQHWGIHHHMHVAEEFIKRIESL